VRLGGREARASHDQAHRVAFGAQCFEWSGGESEEVGGDRLGLREFDVAVRLHFDRRIRNRFPMLR